ncbi:hypothetical protein [uncultured Abyssibacter sp.]|uniref:COG4648 family protein n=1 Tax=uncultured Abyssibacter sp. TaxID=2320202 RepID=UPI0032B25767|tara:strand:- start:181 stop:780 length:600 start_codon:yes stop_codon:yes gene_type:complete
MRALWLAYPVLVHAAIVTESRGLYAAALILLLVMSLSGALLRRRLWAMAAIAAGSAALIWVSVSGLAIYFLYLPPVLINGFLCVFFAQSLARGRTPVISFMARQIRGEDLPPPLLRYTHKLTAFWALFFAAMGLISIVLAIWASNEVWSLFTNFISYLIVAAVFILEFGLRRLIVPGEEHTSIRNYLRGLARTDVRGLR